MKKTIIAVLFSLYSVNTLAVGGGVIVHDAQSALDTAHQWAEEAKQWAKDTQAYKDELLSKTGIRDVQALVEDAQSVQSQYQDIYNSGKSFYTDYVTNGKANFSSNVQSILDKYDVTTTCKNLGYSGTAIQGCEAQFADKLGNIGFSDDLIGKMDRAQNRLSGLINKVKNSKDPKETADATNALALENVQFEKMKFQYEMFKDKQKAMADYQQKVNVSNYRKSQSQAQPMQLDSSSYDLPAEFN